jgi:hypothetical protein
MTVKLQVRRLVRRGPAHAVPAHRQSRRRSDYRHLRRRDRAQVPHPTVLPAIHGGHRREPVTPEATEQIADAESLYEPGRIERTLRALGVTDIDLLRRGGEIDRTAEQLIVQAAAENEARPTDPSTPGTHAQDVTDTDRQGRRAMQAEEAEAGH